MPLRPIEVLRTLAFYAAFYIGSIGFVLAASGAIVLYPRVVRPIADGWSAYHRRCTELLLGIKVRMQGELPAGQYLAAIKHESFFEAIDLPNLLDGPVVFAKAELMRIPLWGRVGAAYGLVGVDREKGAKALREMVAAARQLTASGRSAAIFPEGTRVPHGQQPALQSGFAGLYKLLGMPVVPIAVDSGPVYQRRMKRKGTITYCIGEAIPPGLPREEVEARVHAAINALNPPAPA
jgi:1-acyl-sn-glycerol-3-phosphate acyltransferase